MCAEGDLGVQGGVSRVGSGCCGIDSFRPSCGGEEEIAPVWRWAHDKVAGKVVPHRGCGRLDKTYYSACEERGEPEVGLY